MYRKTRTMKTTLMTTCLLLLGFTACAQTESELAQWQANNPEKLVMSRQNFNLLDPATQELIKSSVVFDDQIALEFKSTSTSKPIEAEENAFTDRDFIKQWLSRNQDIKIVTRSEYDTATPYMKSRYDDPSVLVLIGEVLTKADILNY